MAVFKTNILRCFDLDICGSCARTFNFCRDCWIYISGCKESKFSISNKMPQMCCHHHSEPLKGLTSAEEDVIARAHPVITISKLRPNNNFNCGFYKGIRPKLCAFAQKYIAISGILFSESKWLGWIRSTNCIDCMSLRSSLTSSTFDLPRVSKGNWFDLEKFIKPQSKMSSKLDPDSATQLWITQVAFISLCSYNGMLIHHNRML